MGFSYRVLKAYKNGLNVSTSKKGLNVSYTLDVGFGETLPAAKYSSWAVIFIEILVAILLGVWLWPW